MFDTFGPNELLQLYRQGVFPMADGRDDPRLMLIDPDYRGIIPLDNFHIPRRLKRFARNINYEIRANYDFRAVINSCAQICESRYNTWINDRIINLYCQLNRMGYAHSVEVWHENILIGGLYGIALGGAFFGESMFSRQTNASKIATIHLIAALKYAGFTLLDAQFHNNHLEQFGLIEITRNEFQTELKSALEIQCNFPIENLNGLKNPKFSSSLSALEFLQE